MSRNVPKSLYYSQEELALVGNMEEKPRHIAIIMDGNRRWAKKNSLNKIAGHWAGASVLSTIVEATSDLGMETLTVYGFSTENWRRSQEEIDALLEILQIYLEENHKKMIDENVRFHVIGDLTPFPISLKKTIEEIRLATQGGNGINFVIALNYGGRDEMRRVIQELVNEVILGNLQKDSITEEIIASYLDTACFGDPDLLIRTSGEKRISNFLLWQLAYAEMYVTETLWPEFTPRDLLSAVLDFQKRQRRNGK